MLFKNAKIMDENFDIIEDGYLRTEGDRITYIGKEMPEEIPGEETCDGKGKLLMPGFFNAHAHSPMALMRGYGENLALQDWLMTRIFPFEDYLNSNAVYWGTMLCMAESLKFGIVSTSDMYYFVEDMARAVDECGAKANISRSIANMDGSDFDSMESVKETKKAVAEIHGKSNGRILMDTSLHAEYTSDERTARALAEYTLEEGLIMHVHVAETKNETEECKERHGGKTPVQYLADCGIFDPKSIAAHCVWLEEADYEILKEKGVTVATNPASNMKLASGICDAAELLARGVKLAVGTDSVASNNNLNYIEELKFFALASKVKKMDPTVVTPKEALFCGTRAGAIAQGREDSGSIKVGNKADIIALDISQINMGPVHDLIGNVLYSASGSDVSMTMVDGKVLYKDGDYVTIDKEKTLFEVDKAVRGILSEL